MTFKIGFLIGLLFFFAANLFSYYSLGNKPILIDANAEFGLPFKLYMSGGFAGDSILWYGLIANILIAFCASTILGLASEKVFKKS